MFMLRLFQLAFICLFALGPASIAKADGPQRPLVFIPGILGSELSDGSGNVIWGNRNSLSNYSSL